LSDSGVLCIIFLPPHIHMDPLTLTTKDVARLCKVSDATVKRWEEAGLIRSERTSGGHRRFRAEEVARFQKESSLGLKQNHGDESVHTAAVRPKISGDIADCELFNSLVAGKEEEAANILIKEFLDGVTVSKIFDDNVSHSMQKIGDLWFEGKLSVAREHLATRAALCAVHKLRNSVPVAEPSGKLAFCFAVEGDFHELSTHLAQMVLELQGWEVLNFGSNMPFFSVMEEIRLHSPDLVCISSTIMYDVERLSHDYEQFAKKVRTSGISVVFGGMALQDKKIHARFPADHYPADFSELANIASSLAS